MLIAQETVLFDLKDPKKLRMKYGEEWWQVARPRFMDALRDIADDDAVVLWDRDVSPHLTADDTVVSVSDGGDPEDRWYGPVHATIRVYFEMAAACWSPKYERWWFTREHAEKDGLPGPMELMAAMALCPGRVIATLT